MDAIWAFRRGNEAIAQAASRTEARGPTIDFICECSDSKCLAPVSLTLEQYQQIRSGDGQVVVAGHGSNQTAPS